MLKVLNEEDVALLLDLGVLNERADEFSAYTVLGKVMNDRIVRARSFLLPRDFETPYGAVHAVVGAMTPDEKDSLRDRVITACTNRKP